MLKTAVASCWEKRQSIIQLFSIAAKILSFQLNDSQRKLMPTSSYLSDVCKIRIQMSNNYYDYS